MDGTDFSAAGAVALLLGLCGPAKRLFRSQIPTHRRGQGCEECLRLEIARVIGSIFYFGQEIEIRGYVIDFNTAQAQASLDLRVKPLPHSQGRTARCSHRQEKKFFPPFEPSSR